MTVILPVLGADTWGRGRKIAGKDMAMMGCGAIPTRGRGGAITGRPTWMIDGAVIAGGSRVLTRRTIRPAPGGVEGASRLEGRADICLKGGTGSGGQGGEDLHLQGLPMRGAKMIQTMAGWAVPREHGILLVQTGCLHPTGDARTPAVIPAPPPLGAAGAAAAAALLAGAPALTARDHLAEGLPHWS